jgi:hypothetical protein
LVVPAGLAPTTFQNPYSILKEICHKTINHIDFLRFRRIGPNIGIEMMIPSLVINAKYPKGYISFGVFVANLFKILV